MKRLLAFLFVLGCLSPEMVCAGLKLPKSGDPVKKFEIGKSPIYRKGWIDLNKNGIKDVYEDPNAPIDARIENLLSQMTVEEKTCQMVTLYGYKRVLADDLPTSEWKNKVWKDGVAAIDEHLNGFKQWGVAVSDNPNCWPASRHAWALNEVQRFFIEETRLGIPTDFTNEGIRGVEAYKATNFPTQLGLGHTWDRDLIHKVGYITGREGRLLGYTNVYAPILDVGRDQRWGRYEEVYGESPYLVGELGVAMATGMQTNYQVAATAKHFIAYSNNKGGREGMSRVDPQMSKREVENVHVYPWKEVIKRAGLLGVMCSYNDYDGVPIEGSLYWLTERLRVEMGFRGYVVSDSGGVEYLWNKHGVAEDYKEAVRQSVEAGLNVRCTFKSPESYVYPLRELIAEKAISMETIDHRVRDVLRVKFMIGLFDHPYQTDLEAADKEVDGPENQKVALQASRECLVLLKNKDQILPLNAQSLKKVAVIGPNADAKAFALSHYGPLATEVTSVLEGIKNRLGDSCEVKYEKGCDLVDATWPLSEIMPVDLTAEEKTEMDKAVAIARESDVAIMVMGGGQRTCGENKSRSSLQLPGHQEDLLRAVYATGKPIILVMINGRPNSINWADANVNAILEAWYPGAQGGKAVAEALFGDYNPGGKLTVTFPKTVGQIPFNFPCKPNSQIDGGIKPGPNGNQSRINGALYPFGYGLSYTTFEYSDLKLSSNEITPVEPVTVTFKVKNTGTREGDEVVQLYIRDKVGSVTTYEKDLRGFERVNLKPGEIKTVTMQIRSKDLALLDLHDEWVVEPGDFDIMIGASSEDIRLKTTLTVTDLKAKEKAKTANMNNTVFPWEFRAGDDLTFQLKDNAKIDHVEIMWSDDATGEFEVQLTSGGGQFLTLFKDKIPDAIKTSNCGFSLTNASDLRILISKGKGKVMAVKSEWIR